MFEPVSGSCLPGASSHVTVRDTGQTVLMVGSVALQIVALTGSGAHGPGAWEASLLSSQEGRSDTQGQEI